MDLPTQAQYEAEIVYLRNLVDNYKRLFASQEPAAYVLFAKNGNVRMFSRDRETVGPHAVPVYLHPYSKEPDGYAHMYMEPFNGMPVIRFNGGGEVNGSKSVESIPYWLGTSSMQPNA